LFGQSPNDSWYAKVHGEDGYPDVIVGRIPARYTSDVTTVADKVQMYEDSPHLLPLQSMTRPLPGTWVMYRQAAIP
jgi:hypothetical protein